MPTFCSFFLMHAAAAAAMRVAQATPARIGVCLRGVSRRVVTRGTWVSAAEPSAALLCALTWWRVTERPAGTAAAAQVSRSPHTTCAGFSTLSLALYKMCAAAASADRCVFQRIYFSD